MVLRHGRKRHIQYDVHVCKVENRKLIGVGYRNHQLQLLTTIVRRLDEFLEIIVGSESRIDLQFSQLSIA